MIQANDAVWQPVDETSAQQPESEVALQVDGQPLMARSSDTVATALLRSGYTHFALSTKTGLPLAPACLMGVCFGCLCTIDGRTGTQACLEPVREGMIVSTGGAGQ